jgi:hypothetical protein
MPQWTWCTMLAICVFLPQCSPALNIGSLFSADDRFGKKEGGAQELAEEPSAGCMWDLDCSLDGRSLPTDFGKCDFNLLSDTEYLPAPDFYSKCMRLSPSETWKADAEKLLARIEAIQNPAGGCTEPPSGRWHVGRFGEFGMGANIEHFVELLLG